MRCKEDEVCNGCFPSDTLKYSLKSKLKIIFEHRTRVTTLTVQSYAMIEVKVRSNMNSFCFCSTDFFDPGAFFQPRKHFD